LLSLVAIWPKSRAWVLFILSSHFPFLSNSFPYIFLVEIGGEMKMGEVKGVLFLRFHTYTHIQHLVINVITHLTWWHRRSYYSYYCYYYYWFAPLAPNWLWYKTVIFAFVNLKVRRIAHRKVWKNFFHQKPNKKTWNQKCHTFRCWDTKDKCRA
jgi:hypothetical protein